MAGLAPRPGGRGRLRSDSHLDATDLDGEPARLQVDPRRPRPVASGHAEPERRRRPAPRLVPPGAPPTPGTRSGWSRATRTPRSRKVLFAVDPTPRGRAGGRRRGAPTCCWSTTRCSSRPCTASRPRPPRAARSTPCSRRLRAADRPHQRRPGGRRGLRGDGRRARPDRRRARCCPRPPRPIDKLTVYVPVADADRVRAALADGRCRPARRLRPRVVLHAGRGPVPAARRAPARRSARSAGSRRSRRSGSRSCCPRQRAAAVVGAMLAAHPYEEPAYDVVELADPGVARHRDRPDRLGRADDAAGVRRRASPRRCPATAHGVRVAGDPDRLVRRVALCGGAGDFLLDTCAAPTPTSTSPATCGTTGPRSSSSTTARRWSTSPTGRRSGPGCRWSRRGWPEALGDTVETPREHPRHRPLAVPDLGARR